MHTVIREKSPHLSAFLHGTVASTSPLIKLRGLEHILRTIWCLVCEEWWDLHVDKFYIHEKGALPDLIHRVPFNPRSLYVIDKQECAGCPVVVISQNFVFPDPVVVPLGTFEHCTSTELSVNMMPFDLFNRDSLPEILHGYWPLIENCTALHKARDFISRNPEDFVGYLTIDERAAPAGSSQRRCGLHVESPGVMPLIQSVADPSEAQYIIQAPDGMYIPSVEHNWGGGELLRDECVDGGIFMASNIAGTTAVWNCRIDDAEGDFIGAHGDIERLRGVLGPCARTLEAGELIWMTDRTPHESLPIPASASAQRRQYFRLVVGQVSAWFADHSTPNPLGTVPPPGVRIVRGDKFSLYPAQPPSWNCGSAQQLRAARQHRELTDMLYACCLGHLVDRIRAYGITCLQDMVELRLKRSGKGYSYSTFGAEHSKNGDPLFKSGADDYDMTILEDIVDDLVNEYKSNNATKQF